MPENSDLSVLIVDPNPSMRGNLHNMLNQAAITKVEYAVNSGTAIRLLTKKPFDIILCEYDLGSGTDGQDGQQLLEDLRHHKLIGLWTIFIMLTSEAIHSKVISAAELTPTDYILKPFTVDVLSGRIERAIERRAIFLPTYQLIEKGDLREAVKRCRDAELQHPRLAADFARLRAELHITLGEWGEAEQIYQNMLATRPMDWVHLGLARSLFEQQRYEETQETLLTLVEQNPRYMAAYDLLAQTHEALGQQIQAKKILEDAVAISPHMVRRLRHLGGIAYDTGDIGAAERAYKQVVTKAKYSEFRDPEDHVNLVKTLVKKGDGPQASGVLRDLERSMRGSANVEACRAISAAMLHELSGNDEATASELQLAAAAIDTARGLSKQLKVGLVQSCLKNNLEQAASEVMLKLVNEADSDVTMEQAVAVFEQAGRHDLAQGMGQQITNQVQELMQDAASKSENGEFKGAVFMLRQALRKTPGNLPVLFASVDAILRQLNILGWEAQLAEQAQHQMQVIRKIDPKHPKLESLKQQYAATQHKYGIAT
ncbi:MULTISPECIES: tetratricopeptide repeat-containing response regulator [unclassified Janthinobacterium]|uniref:tetratricopeptide repeat-containing response regulator n=1 Tax=unclassified Janthinobacterium TaxID=2610881 RepID=UPI0016173BDC|nr:MULTISPECIES: tetratricopeptide repeat-containing response regulator [unclassified Janthinobacterium]MBB5369875.1 tetratricopeptide (TPR) repeat protein [Janthinobacterium sp. K2C7]MBB5382681.1 tetratricopeptide (TPR) repeat protein [Janthinobacterium sp. K2Li3]MBB5384666.1 tetratricopeptide (TPR) repeat protein [Janthinobacterium sp. K2E3]